MKGTSRRARAQSDLLTAGRSGARRPEAGATAELGQNGELTRPGSVGFGVDAEAPLGSYRQMNRQTQKKARDSREVRAPGLISNVSDFQSSAKARSL